MATDLAKRLYGPAAQATSAATRYTVPANTTTIVRHWIATNTATAPATITVSIGTDAAGTRIWDAIPISAKGVEEFQGFLVMAAAEVLQVTASATTVTFTVSGIETA